MKLPIDFKNIFCSAVGQTTHNAKHLRRFKKLKENDRNEKRNNYSVIVSLL